MSQQYKMLRKYVNQLYLQIHPDFFQSSQSTRVENEKSLSALTSLLNSLKTNPSTTPTPITFTLKNGTKVDHFLTPFTKITALSNRRFPLAKQSENLINGWSQSLYALLQKSGIQISPQDEQILNPKDQQQPKPERFHNVFRRQLSMLEQVNPQNVEYCLPESLIFYDDRLSFDQRQTAKAKLTSMKLELDIPIFVSLKYNRTWGILVFPWDFKPDVLQEFLSKYHDEIKDEFRSL